MKDIIYTGKTKKGKLFFLRYPTEDDVVVMWEYINKLSKERTYISFQGEEISLADENAFVVATTQKIQSKEAVLLLAFCDDILVGISEIEMKTRVESHVGVFGISIAKEHRGEGIGKILMQKVMEESEKHLPQLQLVVLQVYENNAVGKALYKQLGFVEYGTLPQGIKHQEKFVDSVLLYKKVK